MITSNLGFMYIMITRVPSAWSRKDKRGAARLRIMRWVGAQGQQLLYKDLGVIRKRTPCTKLYKKARKHRKGQWIGGT